MLMVSFGVMRHSIRTVLVADDVELCRMHNKLANKLKIKITAISDLTVPAYHYLHTSTSCHKSSKRPQNQM